MADAVWREYELFCPVCNVYFKQLVVVHEVPEGFDVGPYLEGFVERHDHAAFREGDRMRAGAGGSEATARAWL